MIGCHLLAVALYISKKLLERRKHPECRVLFQTEDFFRTLIVSTSVFQVETGNHFTCFVFFFALFFNLGLLQYWILIIYVAKSLFFSYCASIMTTCISNLLAQKKPRVSEVRPSRRHTFVNRTCALWSFFCTNILKEKKN